MKEIIKNEELIKRDYPENYSSEDFKHFAIDFSTKINEIHLLSLSNVKVIQRYIYYNNIILSKYVHSHGVSNLRKFKAVFKPLFYRKFSKTVNQGLWAIDSWSIGYFHWLCEFLPRCISAEKYWESYPFLIPSYFMEKDYILETLEVFPFKVLNYSIYSSFLVKDMIISSRQNSPTMDSCQIKKVRRFFRDFDGFSFEKKKRIYISRRKARKRKVLNEDELIGFLMKFGFETVFMEDLTFSDQRKLMSQSEIIISNHGAGLTNMMFMPDNSAVLELKANSETINNCFFILARALDHKYYYTMNYGNKPDVQNADILVNIPALRNVLLNHLL